MPRFSLFTPFGHLRFSRIPAIGKRLFDLGAAALGDGRPGTYAVVRANNGRTFAWLYAWSMTAGTVYLLQERAGRQWDPSRVTDLLELQEREDGSIPQAGWTVDQRQAQLVRMRRLIQDVSANGLAGALAELLGSAFLAVVPGAIADIVNWPATVGDSPMLLALPTLQRRLATLTSSIATVGSSVIANYAEREPGIDWRLTAGDVVVIEPENKDRAERVTLADAFDSDGSVPYFLQFTPTKPHAAGVSILRAPFPAQTGSKRHSLVVLSEAMAEDPETRRLAQWLMERHARATSTWDLAGANAGDLTAGPFTVGGGKIGITPIGLVTL